MIYKDTAVLIILTIVLTVVQIWLSRKKHWWKGILIPIVYLIFWMPYVYPRFLAASSIRLIPDYYQTATFLFPGIWLLMIYFVFYYYFRYKKEGQ